MREKLTHTGTDFAPGTRLTGESLRIMNSRVNDLIDRVNDMEASKVNINVETGNLEKRYTLKEALDIVPEHRRKSGVVLRFLDTNGSWVSYAYVGSNWTEDNSWRYIEEEVIDGGEW